MMQAEKIFGMWFVRGTELPANLYEGNYDFTLVAISYGLAFFAAYVGLMTAPLISAAKSLRRLFWIFMGSVAMGGGVWAMHFVGMLAFKLPFEVGYNAPLTLLSVFPGILGAAAALTMIGHERFSWARLLLSSCCMALGIGAMHFIGMAAMQAEAAMIHKMSTFLWSLVVAFALAFTALYLEAQLKLLKGRLFKRFRIALVAAIFAFAVSAMHYTGMQAAYFYEGPAHMHDGGWVIKGDMIVVMLNMFVLLLIGFVLSTIMGMSTQMDASLLRNIFSESSDGLLVVSARGVISLCSPAAERMLGYRAQDLVGTHINDLLPPKVRDIHRVYLEAYQDRDEHNIMGKDREVCVVHSSGREVPVEINVNSLKRGADTSYSISLRDITQRKADQLELVKLHQTIEQSPISVIITNLDSEIEYVNPQFSKNTGYGEREVLGRNPRFLNTGNTAPAEYQSMWQSLNEGRVWRGEFRNQKKSGDLYWNSSTIAPIKDDSGNTVKFIAFQEDITLRKDYEERLFKEANFSPLTHQPNRSNILNNIAIRIEQQDVFSLIYVDLVGVGRINNSLGFQAGDDLIIQMARRLDTLLDQNHFLAHLGGDQFLFLVSGEGAQASEILIKDVLNLCREPLLIRGETIHPAVKMGAALHPSDGSEAEELLSHAHSAMNQARERNSYVFYSQQFNQRAHQHLHMESCLREAVAQDQLSVYYQPKIDVRSGRCLGGEALLRWFSPELGTVSPADFIPLAERSELILPISDWVLEQACSDTRKIIDSGYDDFSLAVNISPKQFISGNLPESITKLLRRHRLQSRNLELEVTEGLFLEDRDSTDRQFAELKSLGVALSLDDFGTGYSSLAYLRSYPFDTLKIDQSFVRNLPGSEEDAAVASAIVRMGQALGMRVVAEGVETQSQAAFLKREGCDIYQGYYYAKPMTFAEFLPWLKSNLSNSK